jgi:hypothetical protein
LRIFPGGAIRDDNHDKYEYTRFLDPRCLRAYAAFMHRHRFLRDGTVRDPDNWKNGGFGQEECLASLFRHVMDLWELNDYGESYRPENGEPVNAVETLCAIIFNAHSALYDHLKANVGVAPGKTVGANGGQPSDSSPLLAHGTSGPR